MAGLFGPRRPAFADIAIPVAPAQMPVAPQQQRRGLFGRLGQAVTPDRMMIAGAALRDLGTGRAGALDQTIASIRDAQLQQIEQQRLARQDEWQAEQQGRQRNVWSAQDRIAASAPPEQRDLVTADPSAFIAQRGARDQYQWQRQYDNENPEAITPYQQAQLDLTRRGQNISAANAQRSQQTRPLRGPDANLMTDTRNTAANARGLRGLVQDFISAQTTAQGAQGVGLGPGAGVQIWNPQIRNMSALAARMTGLMRPAGSGATSDFEQRLYARGAPSVDNTPEANAQIAQGLLKAADIADARQFFYEAYAEAYGSLNGAEQAFQASPEFRGLTGEQTAAPSAGAAAPAAATNDPLGIR